MYIASALQILLTIPRFVLKLMFPEKTLQILVYFISICAKTQSYVSSFLFRVTYINSFIKHDIDKGIH